MISHELCGDLDEALQVYDGLLSTLKTDGATGPEKSQTLMHVIKICMRKGDLVEALARLERGLGEKTINPRGEATQLKGMPVTLCKVVLLTVASRDIGQAGSYCRSRGHVSGFARAESR